MLQLIAQLISQIGCHQQKSNIIQARINYNVPASIDLYKSIHAIDDVVSSVLINQMHQPTHDPLVDTDIFTKVYSISIPLTNERSTIRKVVPTATCNFHFHVVLAHAELHKPRYAATDKIPRDDRISTVNHPNLRINAHAVNKLLPKEEFLALHPPCLVLVGQHRGSLVSFAHKNALRIHSTAPRAITCHLHHE